MQFHLRELHDLLLVLHLRLKFVFLGHIDAFFGLNLLGLGFVNFRCRIGVGIADLALVLNVLQLQISLCRIDSGIGFRFDLQAGGFLLIKSVS